jgi:hypothetical protein
MEQSNRKRVLILDINPNGHHPTYVRWLLESPLSRSADMILASRAEMFEHPELKACSTKFTPHIISVDSSLEKRLSDFTTVGLLRMSWTIGKAYRRAFAQLSKIAPIDFVIVPFVDDCLLGLAAIKVPFAGVPWMAITMRTMFHFAQMGVLAPIQRFAMVRRFLFNRILRQPSMVSMLSIDPTLVAFAEKYPGAGTRKISYLPDPATHYPVLLPRSEAKQQLGIPADTRLVLLYGEIAVRKGVLSLLEGAADPACPSCVHVLLAGRCRDRRIIDESETYQRLRGAARVHIIDGYLNADQERQVLSAADCVWAGYTGFYGMSGIMVLSGRHSLPVLASKEGLIGYFAARHGIGILVEPNRQSVIAGLKQFAADPEFFAQAGRKGASLFDNHTPAELQRLVAEKAESWLGSAQRAV